MYVMYMYVMHSADPTAQPILLVKQRLWLTAVDWPIKWVDYLTQQPTLPSVTGYHLHVLLVKNLAQVHKNLKTLKTVFYIHCTL